MVPKLALKGRVSLKVGGEKLVRTVPGHGLSEISPTSRGPLRLPLGILDAYARIVYEPAAHGADRKE